MKYNKRIVKLIFPIVFSLLIVIIVILTKNKNVNNNNDNIINSASNLYSNLNIDKSKLNIFYLNVGQADSTLITMGEDVMLIDAGNKEDGSYIVELLKAQGIKEIDYLIETHSDDDHSGGIREIARNLEIINIYMPKSAIEKSEIKNDININVFSNLEQTYSLDKATWQVLSVNNNENISENEDNDSSIVIQLDFADNKFLFMGDSTNKVENKLIKNNKLEKIDVLKVGHHGSSSSSSQKFLDVVKPTYSIISVNNSEYSKHPAESTVERLKSINSEIYRTDINGTIWITSNGTKLEINELDINVNGNNIKAKLLEDRKYSLIFYCRIFPSLSTTL